MIFFVVLKVTFLKILGAKTPMFMRFIRNDMKFPQVKWEIYTLNKGLLLYWSILGNKTIYQNNNSV